MNAINFLIKQHGKISQFFLEINDESHRKDTQKKIFSELCLFLTRHETMEEKIWYPKLKKLNIDKFNKIIQHLISEEKEANKAIQKIKKINSYETWKEKVCELNKDVEHHAREEETKLFPLVSNKLDESVLQLIGHDMYHFFYAKR